MQSVTEEMLVMANQPQQLLKEYHVPAAMVEIKQID
jgi:hypothetical protein